MVHIDVCHANNTCFDVYYFKILYIHFHVFICTRYSFFTSYRFLYLSSHNHFLSRKDELSSHYFNLFRTRYPLFSKRIIYINISYPFKSIQLIICYSLFSFFKMINLCPVQYLLLKMNKTAKTDGMSPSVRNWSSCLIEVRSVFCLKIPNSFIYGNLTEHIDMRY
jgi:hypothetical protein